jgi:hypothetical protein
LLFKTKRPSKFSEKAKNDFIFQLDTLMLEHGLKGILIFDSNENHARDYPTKSKLSMLEIAHAPFGVEGDLYILEYLQTVTQKKTTKLISSDRELARKAKDLKIESIDSSDFLDFLLNLSSKTNQKKLEAKPKKDSQKEIERWLKIFEEKDTN